MIRHHFVCHYPKPNNLVCEDKTVRQLREELKQVTDDAFHNMMQYLMLEIGN